MTSRLYHVIFISKDSLMIAVVTSHDDDTLIPMASLLCCWSHF